MTGDAVPPDSRTIRAVAASAARSAGNAVPLADDVSQDDSAPSPEAKAIGLTYVERVSLLLDFRFLMKTAHAGPYRPHAVCRALSRSVGLTRAADGSSAMSVYHDARSRVVLSTINAPGLSFCRKASRRLSSYAGVFDSRCARWWRRAAVSGQMGSRRKAPRTLRWPRERPTVVTILRLLCQRA
jgi:hypothetical protein